MIQEHFILQGKKMFSGGKKQEITAVSGYIKLHNGETAQSHDRCPKTVCRSTPWRTEEERVSCGGDGEESSVPAWTKNSWETTQEKAPGERGEGKKQRKSWRMSKETDREKEERASKQMKASRVGNHLE